MGVPVESVTLSGISTDGDSEPGCAGGTASNGMTLNVHPDFAATLGNDEAFADCFLTPDEIASDPEAAIFAAAFTQQVAEQMGVPVESVTLSGISTDGNSEPGCDGSTDSGVSDSAATSTMSVDIHPDFAATLGTDEAFADCYLTPDEIASDPEAAAFAAAFRQSVAASMGVPADSVTLSGISTDGDTEQGCAQDGGQASSSLSMAIHPDFATTLGSDEAFADCFLTPEEIASDPEAAAFAAAFTQQIALTAGVPADDVILSGISTDGDNVPGCASTPAVTQGLTMGVDVGLVAQLGNEDAFEDCFLSPAEIASDPEAAVFAEAFQAQVAASMGGGMTADMVELNGMNVTGIPGCSGGETGRRRRMQSLSRARRKLDSGKSSVKIAALCGFDGVCSLRL